MSRIGHGLVASLVASLVAVGACHEANSDEQRVDALADVSTDADDVPDDVDVNVNVDVPDDVDVNVNVDVNVDVNVPDDADADTVDACVPPTSWTRRVARAGGVVVFDVIEPGPGGSVGLYDPMSVDVDLSGWTLAAGTASTTFPDGTYILGGARRVVPLDVLGADVTVTLTTPAGRLIDTVRVGGPPWPAIAAGQAYVKRDPEAPSGLAESWSVSDADDARLESAVLVPRDALWRYDPTPSGADTTWTSPGFDDSAWTLAAAPFSGGPVSSSASLRATADNAFAVYLGAQDGAGLRLVARAQPNDWTVPETLTLATRPDDYLFIAAWEAPGDSGSPQMLIAELTRADGSTLATGADTFDVVLGPDNANPSVGGSLDAAPPPAATLAAVIAQADAADAFAPPEAELDHLAAPWGGAVGGYFASARFVWPDTLDASSLTNSHETYALFQSTTPAGAAPGTTLSSFGATARFRTDFESTRDPRHTELALDLDVAQAATVWLNGVVLYAATGPARAFVPSDALAVGHNTLAVEVHASATAPPSIRFALTLVASARSDDAIAEPESGQLVVNEIMYHPAPIDGLDTSDWLELHNPGASDLDLSGWQLVDGAAYSFPAGASLAAGGYLVLADDLDAFARDYPDVQALALTGGLANSGERVALLDACGALVDQVRWSDGGRWPDHADGSGASLALVDARADNAVPEAWRASPISGAWQSISYRGVARASPVGPDGQWEELVLGLLDAGEVLIDDVRVIEDPDGAARVLVSSDFESSADPLGGWRGNGTHAGSRVEPDGAGHVLHVIADGPTEHMHNQLAHTLSRAVVDGTTYLIALRARWLAGSDQLNTRLYFNRLARTTRLGIPPSGGSPGRANDAATNLGPTWRAFGHTPLVPRPGESVTVTVLADDPDGVAAVTLWTAIDGAAATATPMAPTPDRGFVRYSATLAGPALAGTIVQMYVEGRDSRGATSTFPARGGASRALFIVADAPVTTGLRTLRIVMTAADMTAFHAPENLMSNAPTGVTVIVDEANHGRAYYDVGVSAKGSERGRPSSARLGYALSFDALAPLRGAFDTVSIDRSEGVITGQREIFQDVAMAHAGSPAAEYNDLVELIAPRPELTGPALLQTGRYSDVVLDNQFADGSDGNLYEYELVYYPTTTTTGAADAPKLPQPDGVRGTAIGDLGDDAEAYRHSFLIKNRRRADDFTPLIAFAKAFRGADFATEAAAYVDLVQWLSSFAYMRLSGAVDHYGNGDQHNAQIYFRPGDPRALLLPHDLDFYPGSPEQPVVGGGDLPRLLALPGMRRVFYAHLLDALRTTWNAAYLAHWRDLFARLLPGQPFQSHYDFMVARAAWMMDGAADAVRVVYPEVAFAITTAAGPPVSAPQVALAGSGWLDVDSIHQLGAGPRPITWSDDTHWQITVPLALGSNVITLEARDRHGALVGSASLTLERIP